MIRRYTLTTLAAGVLATSSASAAIVGIDTSRYAYAFSTDFVELLPGASAEVDVYLLEIADDTSLVPSLVEEEGLRLAAVRIARLAGLQLDPTDLTGVVGDGSQFDQLPSTTVAADAITIHLSHLGAGILSGPLPGGLTGIRLGSITVTGGLVVGEETLFDAIDPDAGLDETVTSLSDWVLDPDIASDTLRVRVVPEPATLALCALGLSCFIGRRRQA